MFARGFIMTNIALPILRWFHVVITVTGRFATAITNVISFIHVVLVVTVMTHVPRLPNAYILEPDRQFALVKEHIEAHRRNLHRTLSKVKVYVERNLGFEAEHHHRALGDLPGVDFYVVSLSIALAIGVVVIVSGGSSALTLNTTRAQATLALVSCECFDMLNSAWVVLG